MESSTAPQNDTPPQPLQSTEAGLEQIPVQQDTVTKDKDSPKKAPGRRRKDALTKSPSDATIKKQIKRVVQKETNSQIHHDMEMVKHVIKQHPYGPILSDILDVFLAHKKKDDDFLRRQKNRMASEVTDEREALGTMTSEWSTQLEASVKAAVRIHQPAPSSTNSDGSEKTETQLREQGEAMDKGINHDILKMLGVYQSKLKDSKKRVDKALHKIENEDYEQYQMSVAEEELQLLTLLKRIFPLFDMNRQPPPPPDSAAALAYLTPLPSRHNSKENVNPNDLRTTVGKKVDYDHGEDTQMMERGELADEPLSFASGSSKKRKI